MYITTFSKFDYVFTFFILINAPVACTNQDQLLACESNKANLTLMTVIPGITANKAIYSRLK